MEGIPGPISNPLAPECSDQALQITFAGRHREWQEARRSAHHLLVFMAQWLVLGAQIVYHCRIPTGGKDTFPAPSTNYRPSIRRSFRCCAQTSPIHAFPWSPDDPEYSTLHGRQRVTPFSKKELLVVGKDRGLCATHFSASMVLSSVTNLINASEKPSGVSIARWTCVDVLAVLAAHSPNNV